MKKICYTVLTNDSDDLKEPLKPNPSWDYVVFTDNPELRSTTWSIELVNGTDPKKLSRFYKVKNHFPEYDISVFIDATFTIKKDLDYFALNKKEGIWLNRHPMRQCAYQEAEVVKEKGLDDPKTVDSLISNYESEGFPKEWGLWRCGIMVRNPRDTLLTQMCETWWKEIEQGTYRDQISFPYACWKTGLKPNSIVKGITETYFKQSLHKAQPTTDWLFTGEGEYDKSLTERYSTAHVILTKKGLLYPKWIKNYVSMKNGEERFLELIKILGGVIVRV